MTDLCHDLSITRLMRASRAAVGILKVADEDGGTRYTARARHWTAQAAERHRAMRFEQGWGAAAEQWEEVARRLA